MILRDKLKAKAKGLFTNYNRNLLSELIYANFKRVLFKFWIGLNAYLPVIDNIYLLGAMHGIGREILKNKTDEILEMASLNHLRFSALKELSIGQCQRLAVSVFFQGEGNLLIFDEALGFVDNDFIQKCDYYFKRLSSSDKTIIMTSHNSDFLNKYCRTAIWLDEGKVRMYGEFNKVNAEYERSFLNV